MTRATAHDTQMTLYPPMSVKRRVEKLAKENKRSIAMQLLVLVEAGLADADKWSALELDAKRIHTEQI